jgi:hypothetical protein
MGDQMTVSADIHDKASPFVVELAKLFMGHIRRTYPKFEKAFFRFNCEPSHYGSKVSIIAGPNAEIMDPIKNTNFFEGMNDIAFKLMQALERSQGVLLLTISPNSEYRIDFEWENMNRWMITKLNGGTGIPVGS